MADNPMNVRIGVSLGAAGVPDQFSTAVDALEAAGADFRPSWAPVDPDRFTADFVRELVPLQT
ncbi:MAG TPA: hypothetical protein VF933_37600 [Streptosporangiaceae bacterium]